MAGTFIIALSPVSVASRIYQPEHQDGTGGTGGKCQELVLKAYSAAHNSRGYGGRS